MNAAAVNFYRSRAVRIALPVVILVACLVGVLGYYFVGPISVEAHDILSAAITTYRGSEVRVVHIDVTDPVVREEMAGLLSSLDRWHGEATEGIPRADLEVHLRDGAEYYVIWYQNGDLKLATNTAGPDRETSVWVRSPDMKRFLAEYLEP